MTTRNKFDINDRYAQFKDDIYYSLLECQRAASIALKGAPKYFVYTQLNNQYIFGVSKFCALKNIDINSYKEEAYYQTNGTDTRKVIEQVLGQDKWVEYDKVTVEIQKAFKEWIRNHVTYNHLENASFLPVFLDDNDDIDLVNSSVDSIKSSNRKISKEHFSNLLNLKQDIGDAGEEIAYQYEVKRLKNKGTVQKTYSQNIAAGYDLYSECNGEKRFIEVKSSLGVGSEMMEFYLSENENQVLEEKGEQGFIYFVNVMDIEKRKGIVYEIPNPIKKINEKGTKKEIKTYQVTLKNELY